jgi:hypothetical protein
VATACLPSVLLRGGKNGSKHIRLSCIPNHFFSGQAVRDLLNLKYYLQFKNGDKILPELKEVQTL